MQVWDISVHGNVIHTRWGQLGGAMQEQREVIAVGKNIGKSNETSPEEQAQKEAYSRWERQLKAKKYVRSQEEAVSGASDAELVKGGIDVMLAKEYGEHRKKVKFPCYAQPKLDGHRCVAVVRDGKCTLWSRTRKPIKSVPHINREVLEMCKKACITETVFDGELYVPRNVADFEELTSLIRKDDPAADHYLVQYCMYDMPSCLGGFEARWANLQMLAPRAPVGLVDTVKIDNAKNIEQRLAEYTRMGFEGVMIRDADRRYENKRSDSLLKYKRMLDSEFKIVDVVEGRGKMKGRGIFVCETEGGEQFQCKMTGELSTLEEYFQNKHLYIGSMLTVQYQELTKAGVPRFPVGLRSRTSL